MRLLRSLAAVAVLAASLPPLAALADPPAQRADAIESYMIFRDDDGATMSANHDELDRVRKLRRGTERLVWFRTGGQEYVVRDAAVLSQIDAIWKPLHELGREMGAIGTQQGAIGTQQGAVGSRMGLLGIKKSTLATRRAALQLRDRDSATSTERADIAKRREAIERESRDLDDQMAALRDQMSALRDQMEPLRRQMEPLSRKMKPLNAKVHAETHTALTRAIASGAAKRL